MSHTVLLIDDEPNVLSGLTRVLRKESYEILTANTAEEAITIRRALEQKVLLAKSRDWGRELPAEPEQHCGTQCKVESSGSVTKAAS